jgi:hypothetical protein
MPRMAPFAAILAALLAGCASPKPPVTAPIAEPARAADPCPKYRDPTTFARCRLFSSADGWRFIPEAGRGAGLNAQLRCAALRSNPSAYERCVSTPHSVAARTPAAPRFGALPAGPLVDTLPDVEPSAGPAQVERRRPAIMTEAAAVARTIYKTPRAPPATVARAVEKPPTIATKTLAIARTVQKAPAAVSVSKQVARISPAPAGEPTALRSATPTEVSDEAIRRAIIEQSIAVPRQLSMSV